MCDNKLDEVLHIFTKQLYKVSGPKLDKVILFGSYARGDQTEYSDIDVLVLLKASDDEVGMIRKKMRKVINEIDWDYDVILSPVYQQSEKYMKYISASGFYQNIDREGIAIGKRL